MFPEKRYFTDYPGLQPDACDFLAERGGACFALDMPSVYAPDSVPVLHRLLRAGILIVKGLAHLAKLKSEQVFYAALLLPIRGRDGSPCHAIAVGELSDEKHRVLSGIRVVDDQT